MQHRAECEVSGQISLELSLCASWPGSSDTPQIFKLAYMYVCLLTFTYCADTDKREKSSDELMPVG